MPSEEHILTADVGGTQISMAIFASADGAFRQIVHETFPSREIRSFPEALQHFVRTKAGRLKRPIGRACLDFAGPVDHRRKSVLVTNLGWSITAEEIAHGAGVDSVILLNDFEAVGFGVEVLLAERPNAFVQLSRFGSLPRAGKANRTAVVIGAGTGLGTAVLVADASTGKYRPIPGEGGHGDFVAVEGIEFEIAQWVRKNINRSPRQPIDREKIVSGPGLLNVYRALSELEPHLLDQSSPAPIMDAEPFQRPALIVKHADRDQLCRKALDIWIRCYARAAKNAALFPLAPGGVFLAGGIAAKILPELRAGSFMDEFTRCDVPEIRRLLRHTPVFVITEQQIGLYGCASVAAAPEQLAH